MRYADVAPAFTPLHKAGALSHSLFLKPTVFVPTTGLIPWVHMHINLTLYTYFSVKCLVGEEASGSPLSFPSPNLHLVARASDSPVAFLCVSPFWNRKVRWMLFVCKSFATGWALAGFPAQEPLASSAVYVPFCLGSSTPEPLGTKAKYLEPGRKERMKVSAAWDFTFLWGIVVPLSSM